MDSILKSPVVCCKKRPIQRGVIIIPIKPEILALNMAAGILPFAIETITTDEDTVDGNAAKNKKESHNICDSSVSIKGLKAMIISGKIKKVVNCTTRCSFQFFKPLLILSGLNFKP